MKIEGKPEARDLVVKGNALVHASYVMERQEKLLMWWLIWAYQKQPSQRVSMNCLDVADYLGCDRRNAYRDVWMAARRLRQREILLYDADRERIGACGFLRYAEYGANRAGEVDVVITDEIKPHIEKFIEQMKFGFTRYEMGVVSSLRTFHGLRLYEIAKSVDYGEHRKDGWLCSFDELRKLFGSLVVDSKGKVINDEYSEWRRFREKVLEKAVADVNDHSDIIVTYRVLKSSRKVTAVRLFMSSNKAGAAVMQFDGPAKALGEAMARLGVGGRVIKKLLTTYGVSDPERLRYALASAAQAQKKGKIKNIAAWFVAAVKRDDRAQGQLFHEREAEKAERRRDQQKREAASKRVGGVSHVGAVLKSMENSALAAAMERMQAGVTKKSS